MATWRDTRVAAEVSSHPAWRDLRIAAEVSGTTTARWRDTRVAAEMQTSLLLPVADPGQGQTASAGELVTLDSTASYSVNGTITSQTWRFISSNTTAPDPVLSSTTDPVVTFRAPVFDQDGIYVFGLVVHDSASMTSNETQVVVSVIGADLAVATSTGWAPAGLLLATSTGWT